MVIGEVDRGKTKKSRGGCVNQNINLIPLTRSSWDTFMLETRLAIYITPRLTWRQSSQSQEM